MTSRPEETGCATLGAMARADLQAVGKAAQDISEAISRRNAAMIKARMSGETWADIAAAAGMTPNGVRKAIGFRRGSGHTSPPVL